MGQSRAAALLESLAGREADGERRHGRAGSRWSSNRFPGDRGAASDHDDDQSDDLFGPRRSAIHRLPTSPAITVSVVAVVVVVLVAIGWRFLAAPSPIDERIRTVSTDDLAEADTVLDATDAESTGSGSPSTMASGTGADGVSADSGDGESDSPRSIAVHVAGAVAHPGVVELRSGSRVVDAVAAAGGFRVDADPDRLNLAATLDDGWRIMVPFRGQDLQPEIVQPDAAVPIGGGSTRAQGTESPDGVLSGGLININTATEAELQALPGVGPSTASAIVSKRDKDGPFRSVDSLIEVRGIGEVKLEGLRDLVTVGS